MIGKGVTAIVLALAIGWGPCLLAAEEAEQAVQLTAGQARSIDRGVSRTLLRATASRELTLRDFWKIRRGLREPEIARQVQEFCATGMIGDGVSIPEDASLQALEKGKFLEWLWEHREEILQFIMLLIEIFSSDQPAWTPASLAQGHDPGDILAVRLRRPIRWAWPPPRPARCRGAVCTLAG